MEAEQDIKQPADFDMAQDINQPLAAIGAIEDPINIDREDEGNSCLNYEMEIDYRYKTDEADNSRPKGAQTMLTLIKRWKRQKAKQTKSLAHSFTTKLRKAKMGATAAIQRLDVARQDGNQRGSLERRIEALIAENRILRAEGERMRTQLKEQSCNVSSHAKLESHHAELTRRHRALQGSHDELEKGRAEELANYYQGRKRTPAWRLQFRE